MVKRVIGFFIVSVFWLATISPAQQKEKHYSFSLEDCILKAMENNLGVAVEVLSPELSDISVSLANEKFMPNLSFSYNRRDTNSPSYSFLDAAEQVSALTNNYSAQISQLIPIGGSFSISLDGYKTETNRRFTTINPRYGNTLTFNFSQPLLKNFRLTVNRREIIIAQNNSDISENTFKRFLQDTIYSVEEAYWNLVYSIENPHVRKHSLKLAKDLLKKNKRTIITARCN